MAADSPDSPSLDASEITEPMPDSLGEVHFVQVQSTEEAEMEIAPAVQSACVSFLDASESTERSVASPLATQPLAPPPLVSPPLLVAPPLAPPPLAPPPLAPPPLAPPPMAPPPLAVPPPFGCPLPPVAPPPPAAPLGAPAPSQTSLRGVYWKRVGAGEGSLWASAVAKSTHFSFDVAELEAAFSSRQVECGPVKCWERGVDGSSARRGVLMVQVLGKGC